MQIYLPLSPDQESLIVTVAKKLRGSETGIATEWAKLYDEGFRNLEISRFSKDDLRDQVHLFLTSLEDGDFGAYFARIENAGIKLARAKASYEHLIVSFHLFEDASGPFLEKALPNSGSRTYSTLDHLYHNVIAILARAYFSELEREREKLVSILAHDLKTPLTSIILNSASLSRNMADPDKQAQLTRRISGAAKSMSDLIDSTLEYGRLKAGKSSLKLEQINLMAVVTEAATVLLARAHADHLRVWINGLLSKDWGLLGPVSARADHNLTWRAVTNLLSNAVKHARTAVRVSVVDEPTRILIQVRDDGPGIAPELTRSIFEDYFVIPGAKAGTGLGLPSVRMIIELHKGEFGVNSEVGQGAEFWVTVPKA